MSLVFTLPGKAGDALHQYPVAYWYCQQNNTKCTLWLDEHTLKPLVPLFASQPCVESVVLKSGIQNWTCGGQPWDFGLDTSVHLDHEIYHLGMRKFPSRQITLETLEQVPLHIEHHDDQKCLMVVAGEPKNRLLLHGTFLTHSSGVPSFWRFLADIREQLESEFEEIVFIGNEGEQARALELYPEWKAYDDRGNFLHVAEYMASSRLVIGAGSCMVALAADLGVPSVRVHDPIGDHPKVIWSNLGHNQINETERDLRAGAWSRFWEEWVAPYSTVATISPTN